MKKIFILFYTVFLGLTFLQAQTVYYVTPAGTTTGNATPSLATSWATATNNLQAAISTASSGAQVWVAGGMYQTSTSFNMKIGVSVYGGFNGSETMLNQRDTTNTIVAQRDTLKTTVTNNSVVKFTGTVGTPFTGATVLSGFTITGATAVANGGAGIYLTYASPTLSHLIVTNNDAGATYGAGVYFTNSSSPVVSYCTITKNTNNAGGYGGGVMIDGYSLPLITHSTISYNSTYTIGAGIYNANPTAAGALTLLNDTITNNTLAVGGYRWGGGIYSAQSSLVIKNSVVSNNFSYGGGGISLSYAYSAGNNPSAVYAAISLTVKNCQINNNIAKGQSGVQGAGYGAGIFYYGSGSVIIDSTSFDGNKADALGGAIAIQYASSNSITHSVFTRNTTDAYGGAIYLIGGPATFSDLIFHKDSAFSGPITGFTNGAGGAMFLTGVSTVNINNTVFDSCVATGGAAIYQNGSPTGINIINSTFYRNLTTTSNNAAISTVNGAVQVNSTASNPVAIKNCLFYANIGNYTTRAYADILGTATTTVNNCLSNPAYITGPSGSFIANGNILLTQNALQLFTDSAHIAGTNGKYMDADDGLHMFANTSQGFNIGNNSYVSGITNDITESSARIQNSIVDAGAYEGFASIVLPVILTKFTGSLQDGLAQLYWQTADETNMKGFQLEKSRDGKNFEPVNSQPAKGNNSVYNYGLSQTDPVVFYRLKIATTDGRYTYSAVVALTQIQSEGLQLFPNPANNNIHVRIKNAAILSIYDLKSSLIKIQNAQAGINDIDISNFKAGMYICLVNGYRQLFVKQ